mgnify:CR=1 FL=1
MNQLRNLALGLMISTTALAAPEPRAVDQRFSSMVAENRETVMRFLAQDCEVGEAQDLQSAALQLSSAITPLLKAMQQEGPPSEVLQIIDKAITKRWQARVRFLQQGAPQTLSLANTAAARSTDEDSYKARQRKAAIKKYQERATLLLKMIENR